MTEQIVVTGLGLISSLGCDPDTAVEALARGTSGLRKTDAYGTEQFLAPVKGFKVADYLNPNKARRMDPINCYTIAVGKQTLDHAGLAPELRRGCGLLVGTGFSGLRSVVEHQKKYLRDGIKTLSPLHFPTTVYNASAGLAAIELGVAGPNSTVTGVDVSGEQAVLYGCMLLRQGHAERILVVGADELSSALIEAFTDLRLAHTDPDRPPHPYTRDRSGFAPSEGAAALLLETASAARAREARVLGTIEGIGLHASARDPFNHDPLPDGAEASIRQALERAGRSLGDMDWISSPASGSRTLDAADIALWRHLLGDGSPKVTALKAYAGEYAASGVLRLVLGLACAARGVVPAMDGTLDYEDGIAPLLNRATESRPTTHFLHHGTGIGGSQISIVVGRAAQ
jgi:3-oxoacyl-[acyl-carrier-protein] synthase II